MSIVALRSRGPRRPARPGLETAPDEPERSDRREVVTSIRPHANRSRVSRRRLRPRRRSMWSGTSSGGMRDGGTGRSSCADP